MSKYRRSHAAFKLPNELVLDTSLSFSARRLGAVLYSRRNPFGGCRKSMATLATLAGMSVTTARKAISELSDAGYIAHINTYRYDERLGRMVYAVGVYQCLLPVSKGFTLIPWSIFDTPMKSSVFVAALYLYLQTGNSTRSHPSLRAICRDIGAGIATVCRAVKALGFVRLFLAMRCRKKNRAFSSNSYHVLFTVHGGADVPASSSDCRPKPQLIGSAPFPYPKYTVRSLWLKVFSAFKGALKIDKLSFSLAVGAAPDVLLLSGMYQLLAKIRVSN